MRDRIPTVRSLGSEGRLRLVAVIRLVPEHYSAAAGVVVPRCWSLEVTEGLPAPLDEQRMLVMAPSVRQTIRSMIADLQACGLHGRLRVRYDHGQRQAA